MNNIYCYTVHLYQSDTGKFKMDTGIVPAHKSEEGWQSDVSREEFLEKYIKTRNYNYTFVKQRNNLFIRFIFTGKDNLKDTEIYILPKIQKRINVIEFFNFKMKKFLSERVKRILDNLENS